VTRPTIKEIAIVLASILCQFHLMKVFNLELLKQGLATKGSSVKFILNDTAIVFLPITQQHRDVKEQGLSYEDDYRGNAVAGLVTPSGAEIRFHQAYSDERIRTIWLQLKIMPAFSDPRLGRHSYQGREILV
jgi:hypothetical protein